MKKFIIVISFFTSINLFAHGGKRPGPHGGKIKMPGMFHTELIINKNHKSFKVYLLDINFKNPTTKNSFVNYSINKSNKVTCKSKNSFFICKTDEVLKKGMSLRVYAKRLKVKGTASYTVLPNKMKSKRNSKMHH
tara:strand:- start:16 stop:420 length:405 start_codon:yes stop_codon:yes gene_type:complete